MRKPLVVLILVAVLGFSKITVWFSWEGLGVFKDLVKRFSEETGIEVEVSYVPKGADDKLLASWKAGKTPDVVLLKNDEIGRLKDLLQDLEKPRELSGKSLAAFTIGGKLKGVPIYADIGGVFFYRKPFDVSKGTSIESLVKEIGGKKNALMIPIYGRYYFQVFQVAFGGLDLTLKDESTRKTLEFLVWLKRRVPYLPKDGRSAIALFMRGDAKVLMFGSFLIGKFESKKLDYGIMPPPLIERAGRRISPNLDYKGFVVVKGKLNNEVREFLKFVSSKGFQAEFCSKTYKLPTNVKAMEALSKEKPFSELLEYEKFGHPTPTSTSSWRYYEAVMAMLKLLARNVDDVDVLLKAGWKVIEGE